MTRRAHRARARRATTCALIACALIASRAPAHARAVNATDGRGSGSGSDDASAILDAALDALDAVSSAIANVTNATSADVGFNVTEVLAGAMEFVRALDAEGDAATRVNAGDASAEAIRALEAEMRALRDGLNNETVRAAAAAGVGGDDDDDDEGDASEEDDADEDEDEDSGDIEAYLLDTSTVTERAIRPKIVEPMVDGTHETIGLVLADVGKPYGESTTALALGRFAQRLGAAVIRPGTCACASGKTCACDGACVVNETSVAGQMSALGGARNVGAIVASAPRATWMLDVAKRDSLWVGEVAHPVEFAFERMYRAAKHYILNGDDEFAPVPSLLECAAFKNALKPLREKCATARCKTRFEDMRRYISVEAKRAIFTCDGFVDSPQTKHLRGSTAGFGSETAISASRRTRAKYALLLPLGATEEVNLIALSHAFGLRLSDLLVYIGGGSARAEDGYDVNKEPKDLISMLTAENRVDDKLYEDVQKQLEDVYAEASFEPRRDALQAMLKAAARFCDDHKVCSSGRPAKDTLDIDAAHATVLGEFPASCGTRELAREVTCVEDWFMCEGPGASGSVWYSSNDGDDATSSTSSTVSACEPTKCEPTACVGNADEQVASTASYESRASDEASMMPSAGASNDAEDAMPKPNRKSVADITMKAAVNVHHQAPWMWYSMVFILIAVTLTSCAHARLVDSSGPASSLELGASIVRDRPVSAKEIGREMSANDEFWQGGARAASSPQTSGRGTGRDSGNAGRRPAARARGPMTAEERAFYDEL